MKRKKRDRGILIVVGILVAVVVAAIAGGGIFIFFCMERQGQTIQASNSVEKTEPVKIAENDPKATDTEQETVSKARLIAVGDNLIHQAVYDGGKRGDGTYDHRVLYQNISKYLEESDIRVINQETIIGGDEKGFKDYPVFNTPEAIGDAVADVGFNVILQASNHSFDMGLDGLLNAANFWKIKHPEVTMVGIYETEEEQSEIPVLEVNGIKFALLNYTYSHNAEFFSTKAEGHLNMLCAYDENSRAIDFNTLNSQVLEDIRKAEELADFTIVFPHWGVEYVMSATDQEKLFARQMTEAGADLIIGTHPHVIQPVEWVTADNGNRALCYYSLGNFTSAQDGVAQMLGGMASLTIVKEEEKVYIDESSIKAIPLVTHFIYPGWSGSTVVESTYLLNEYTDEQAAAHGLKNAWGITLTGEELMRLAQETFGGYLSME
ncbi:CapA family protein [Roseburia hominis]